MPDVRLNLGCGRDIRAGWVNIDSYPHPGVDVVLDLDDKPALPFPDNSVDHIEGSHVIEHLWRPFALMQELWRVARPDATAVFRCPYGSSDDADEDPTHVRRLFLNSWRYFEQPVYWRAHYGYAGDWQPVRVDLFIHPNWGGMSDQDVKAALLHSRNVVQEMVATLRAVKPAREPRRDLQQPFEIVLRRIGA